MVFKYFDIFVSILSTSFAPTLQHKHDPRLTFLQLITPTLFAACSSTNKRTLFLHLATLAAPSSSSSRPEEELATAGALQSAAREVLLSVLVDVGLVAGYLTELATRGQKEKGIGKELKEDREWRSSVTAVLEVLRARATDLLPRPLPLAALLPPLVALLPLLHHPSAKDGEGEEDGEEMEHDTEADPREYPVQLTLTSLTSVLSHLRSNGTKEDAKMLLKMEWKPSFLVQILKGAPSSPPFPPFPPPSFLPPPPPQ